LQQTHGVEVARGCIRDLKFAPNGTLLAVGSEPQVFEFYSVHENYKRKATLKKHNGPVNHLDWSTDSHYVQTTSESQELIYFSAQDTQQITELKQNVRNEKWSTLNCVYGWSVQGIWKDHMKSGTEITAVDRSQKAFFNEYKCLAVGDDCGELRLYKYPCVSPDAAALVGRGHSSNISNVKWMCDDKYIVTTGGEDQTIILWKVDKAF
jgi:microtubule-associated protein-like 1/2